MSQQKDFKINNFDLLRLIAATQVVFDHYFQHLNIPIGGFALRVLYLFPGVPVFFIISGYLISASYERNHSLKIYFKNRALRIFPGLWGCVFLTILVISITGVSFLNKQAVAWLPAQLVGLIYTPGFLSNYGFGSYNGSLWTIPIELQFYMVLPVCYLLAPKYKITYWFCGLFAVFIGLNVIYQLSHFSPLITKLLDYSFITHFYLFLAGLVLQRLRIYNAAFIYGKALYWVGAYALFCLAVPGDIFNPVVFLIIKNLFLALTLLSIAYTLPGVANKLLHGNDISYGIYIYHGLILTLIVQLGWARHINIFVVLILAYMLGYLSWRYIEKPFIKRKEKTIRHIG